MRGHEHSGVLCPHPTKGACDKIRKEALGKCVSMTADKKVPTACRLWATSIVDEKPLCSMHAGKILNDQLDAARAAAKRTELDGRIDSYIWFRLDHPSVWDRMPSLLGSFTVSAV